MSKHIAVPVLSAALAAMLLLPPLLLPRIPAAAEGPAFRWLQDEGSLTLKKGERTLWRLNFQKAEGKPYFHPVAAAGGTELTWHRPPDHPWHRALWFSWKFIDGVNYWEENPATGKVDGETEILGTETEIVAGESARIAMRLSYHPPGKPVGDYSP